MAEARGEPLRHGVYDDTPTLFRGQSRLAMRFAREHSGKVIWIKNLGWLYWTGTHWKMDDRELPRKLAMKTVANARRDSVEMGDSDRKQLWRDCETCNSSRGITGMLELAESLGGIGGIAVDDLDKDPYLFNCQNGTLDLRTGELLRHNPKDLITKVAGASYDSNATGITFLRFLEEVLPDAEVRDYVQRLVGYAMLGIVKEHILPLFIGLGRNGKSKLLEVILRAFGHYGLMGAPTLLLERSSGAATTDKVDLMGKRLVVCSESDEGNRFAASTVKLLTGGDTVTARKMHQNNISFMPSHTVIMMTNHLPTTDGSDSAMFERLKKVTFPRKFIGKNQDPTLSEKLSLELEVVLRWAVEGYEKYTLHGLGEPQRVIDDTHDYQLTNDPLGRWIEERVVQKSGIKTSVKSLYESWSKWNDGMSGDSTMSFSMKLQDRGYIKTRISSGKAFEGIGLLEGDDD